MLIGLAESSYMCETKMVSFVFTALSSMVSLDQSFNFTGWRRDKNLLENDKPKQSSKPSSNNIHEVIVTQATRVRPGVIMKPTAEACRGEQT